MTDANSTIAVSERSAKADGRCNACKGANAKGDDRVWQVEVAPFTLRLCDYCMNDLMEKAKSAFRRNYRSGKAS